MPYPKVLEPDPGSRSLVPATVLRGKAATA